MAYQNVFSVPTDNPTAKPTPSKDLRDQGYEVSNFFLIFVVVQGSFVKIS